MRHRRLLHFAGKGPASGKETRQQVPNRVPPDGAGTDEELRQRLGAGGCSEALVVGVAEWHLLSLPDADLVPPWGAPLLF